MGKTNIDIERLPNIVNQIVEAFKKSTAAGYICVESLRDWDKYERAELLYQIYKCEELPDDVRNRIYLNNYRYSRLLHRFGNEEWMEIEKEWLKKTSPHPIYYLRTMAKTRQKVPKDECLEILYDLLQEEFSFADINELWQINERYTDEYGHTPPLAYHFDEIRLRSPNEGMFYVGAILDVFAQMEYYDIVACLISWGDSMNLYLEDTRPYDDATDEFRRAKCKQRFTDYINLLRNEMPPRFLGIEACPGFEISFIEENYRLHI